MTKIKSVIIFLFLLFLPVQLGKHFFFDFSYINGVRIDYLSVVIYLTDLLFFGLALTHIKLIAQYIIKNKIMVLFLFALFVVNIAQTSSIPLAAYAFFKIIEIYICFIIFRSVKKDQYVFFLPLLIGVFVEIVLALLQFYKGASLQGIFYFLGERFFTLSTPGIAKATFGGREFLRPYGSFSHPNSMAGFYVLIYAASLYLANSSERFKNFVKYGLMLTCSMIILLSFSKTAIIAYILITVIYHIKAKKRCKVCLLSQAIIIIVLSLIFLRIQSDPFSLYKRFLLLSESIEIIQAYPLLGVGLGHYLYYHILFPSNLPYFHLQPVHNIIMLYVMQVGIVISAFTALGLFMFLKSRWKLMVYPLLALFLTGFFDHYWLTLQQNILLFGTIFGFLTQAHEKNSAEKG